MRARFPRTDAAILAAGGAIVVMAVAGALAAGPPWSRRLDNLHWTVAYGTSALLAFRGWRRAEGRVRVARGWFAAALASYAAGQVAWDLQVALGWNPFPGPSDLGFVLLGPGLAAGLLVHYDELSRADRRTALLDALSIGVVVLGLTLALYLPRRGGVGVLITACLVAYPVFLLSAAGFGFVLFLHARIRPRASVVLFGAATLANGLNWMEWNSRTLDGMLSDGVLFNAGFSLTALLQGTGAALWKPEVADEGRLDRFFYAASRSLPLLLVLVASAAVALAGGLAPVAGRVVYIGAVVVVVVAMARQSLVLGERDQLLVAERKAAESEERSRDLERRLTQAQKLEALGTLAGGIAHDFNNLLMAIQGHAVLLSRKANDAREVESSAQAILSASDRGRDVVRRMMAFSRRQEPAMRRLRVEELVEECAALLRAALPATLELRTTCDAGLPAVSADPSQIHQVLMNLATNAAHAMGVGPGVLGIEVGLRRVGPEGPVREGTYVELRVRDSGCGMDEETRQRIFEPFFTTKGPDKGTGLGLSVVHGIVVSHDGAIEVESARGKGTTFRVLLPAMAEEDRARDTPSQRASASPATGGGREVLVVDDEPLVGAVLSSMLTNLGFRVVTSREPPSAIALVQEAPSRFCLVITDGNMPGMTGAQMAARLRTVAPAVPVVLSSGNAAREGQETFAGVLTKPYDEATLASTVTSVLRQPGTSNATPA